MKAARRPAIKVCGVNDAAFAVEAARLGVDYLGFIFEASSPRNVTPEQARRILAILPAPPAPPRRVGVFVRQPVAEILAILDATGLEMVQLHRRATPEEVTALRASGHEVWTLGGGAPGDGVLFDSSHGDGVAVPSRGPYKMILAGGISGANVAEALRHDPDILDVNSSLECAPGVKDIGRLRDFLAAFGTFAKT